MASPLSASLEVNGERVENPVRAAARLFAYLAAVFNDPEVMETSDQFFGAMGRATAKYRLTLEPGENAHIPELQGGGTDDHG